MKRKHVANFMNTFHSSILSVFLLSSVYLSSSLSACPTSNSYSVRLSVHISVCQSFHLSVCLSAWHFVSFFQIISILSVFQMFILLFIYFLSRILKVNWICRQCKSQAFCQLKMNYVSKNILSWKPKLPNPLTRLFKKIQ